MKPASIIALIISVMLLVIGFSTCLIAKNMAAANGEMLFSEKQSEGYVNRFSFQENEDVTKIDLKADNASVYIYGQSNVEEPYVEIVNFREGYYTATHANQVFSFTEVPDILSMFKFWENGFSFRGMRYILNFNNRKTDDEKIIRIYLNNSTGALKILNLEGDNCNVYLEDLSNGTDFKINLSHGSLTADTLYVTSSVQITGEDLTLNVSNVLFSSLQIDCTSLQMIAEKVGVSSADIQFTDGKAEITPTQSISQTNCNLTSDNGTIYINGNAVGTSYQQVNRKGSSWNIRSESGTIAMQNASSATAN